MLIGRRDLFQRINELRNGDATLIGRIGLVVDGDPRIAHRACRKQTIDRVCLRTQGLKKLPHITFQDMMILLVVTGRGSLHALGRVMLQLNQ